MADLLKKVEKVAPNQARKRGVNKEKWKRERKRQELYASKAFPQPPQCNHKKNTAFHCSSIKMQDVARMHRNFYKLKTKIDQDNFILQHCRIAKCERTRLKNATRGPKNVSAEYYITVKNPYKQIRICKYAFLKILNVGKDRVTGIIQRSFKNEGTTAKENRGGDRKSARYSEKRRKVEQFIETLEAAEPHYCRSKSSVRLYLPPELNIVKLWKMYQEQTTPELKVKQSFFRKIFNTKYNVGFGSPLKDTCSRCFELNRKIETAATSEEKQNAITLKRIHTLKAKAFYDLLKVEADNTLSLSFDCQKNSPLPKLPDQAAYFSRQFNLYNFTVVIGTSKSALDKVNTYYWCENEYSKSSNEIASAVFHTLNDLVIPETVDKVRLFADGCGGQNKNTTLVGMCTH